MCYHYLLSHLIAADKKLDIVIIYLMHLIYKGQKIKRFDKTNVS